MDKIQNELRNLVIEKKYLFIEEIGQELLADHIRFIPADFDSIPKPTRKGKFTKVAWIEFKCKPKSSPDTFNNPFLGSLSLLLVVKSKSKDNQTKIMFEKAHKENKINLNFFNNMVKAEDVVEKNNYTHFHTKCLLKDFEYNSLLSKNDREIKEKLSDLIDENIQDFIEKLRIITK